MANAKAAVVFKSEKAFRAYLAKASKPKAGGSATTASKPGSGGIWVEFVKAGYGENAFSQKTAVDIALCFGWTFGILKSLGHDRYAIHFAPRKKKSAWSASMVKRFKQLQRDGVVEPSGLEAFKRREKSIYETEKPEFSRAQTLLFKKNKKAWAFFESQTDSYRKYMVYWVLSGKREETQAKRLNELIADSAAGTKLKRVVEATERHNERQKTKYPAGETPIETAKNIGPVVGAELRTLGITTIEHLQKEGWESVALRWVEMYPQRLHTIPIKVLAGACEGVPFTKLDSEIAAHVRALISEMKRGRF